MPVSSMRILNSALSIVLLISICVINTNTALAQRKPDRTEPPKFTGQQFDSVFFPDPKAELKGPKPTTKVVASISTAGTTKSGAGIVESAGANDDPMGWSKLITPAAIEDLVKGGKLRLDQAVTTPAAFAGGGVKVARKEFSLQALLFAVIEKYPGDVRWKKSAPVARELFSRVAANAKVGSPQVFAEAKKRLQDLGDLTNGSAIAGEASSEVQWGNLIDRVPLMELLEWTQQEHINPHSASEAEFAKHKEELQRYAELVSVLGKSMLFEGMPDASDGEYIKLASDMIEQASQIGIAVKTENAEAARQAAGKMGQCCTNCHDNFR